MLFSGRVQAITSDDCPLERFEQWANDPASNFVKPVPGTYVLDGKEQGTEEVRNLYFQLGEQNGWERYGGASFKKVIRGDCFTIGYNLSCFYAPEQPLNDNTTKLIDHVIRWKLFVNNITEENGSSCDRLPGAVNQNGDSSTYNWPSLANPWVGLARAFWNSPIGQAINWARNIFR